MIDPSKDKFAYFKDNIQTAEDKDFDASQYYYHRDDFTGKPLGASSSGASASHMGLSPFHPMGGGFGNGLDTDGLDGLPGPHGVFSGFSSSGMMSNSNSFLSASVGRNALGSSGSGLPLAPPHHHEQLHRMNSSDHLANVVKGRMLHAQLDHKTPPDMSEFPALGARMHALNFDVDSDVSRSRAPLPPPPSEFVIQKEDFPALSPFGTDKRDSANDQQQPQQQPPQAHELKRHGSFSSSAMDGMAPSQQQRMQAAGGSNTSIGSRNASGNSNSNNSSSSGIVGFVSSGASLSGGSSFGAFHAARPPPPPPTGTNSTGSTEQQQQQQLDPTNKFGLLGMLHTVIRPSSDSDDGADAKKSLALGCDLTSLGLNLNSAEPLHPTFASPWAEGARTLEPQFALPLCYYNQPPVLKTTHLSKFHIETLFYIFYSMPKDVLQAYAAQELYSRDWRYHTELKLWLKRATPADTALLAATSNSSANNGNSSATSSQATTATNTAGSPSANGGSGSIGAGIGSIGSGALSSNASAGSIGSIGSSANAAASLQPQFLYFDTAAWERRVFTGNIHAVSTGLMSEDEIRVKYNATS